MSGNTINAAAHIQAALDAANETSGGGALNLGNPFDDPPEPMVIPVDVHNIRTRVINPRGSTNIRREQIRDSLRETGFTQVIDITRRPGDEHYITAAGGDTRVEEAQGLCDETGDARFCEPLFRFVPWTNASTVMGNALAENLVRGDMGWWETAAAVMQQKALLESDLAVELSIRKLAKRLSAQGIPIGKSVASLYQFAVSRLSALSDESKRAITKESVTALQPVVIAVEKLGMLQQLPEQLLQLVLQNHIPDNDGGFALERLVATITEATAEALQQPVPVTSAAIDYLKGGGKADTIEELLSSAMELSTARAPARRSKPRDSDDAQPSSSQLPGAGASSPITGDLERDRATAVELVQSVADLYQLAVLPISAGYGFTLDLPDPTLDQHDIHRVSAFWLLLLTSESTASESRVRHCAAAGSTLMAQIASGSVAGVIEPIWAQLGHTTLLDTAFSSFDQLIQLLSHCRGMRAAHPNLWEIPG